jgi:hypothetical protein
MSREEPPGQGREGAAVPDRSGDDSDVGWGRPAGDDEGDARDSELIRDRPPHWD